MLDALDKYSGRLLATAKETSNTMFELNKVIDEKDSPAYLSSVVFSEKSSNRFLLIWS